MSERLKLTAYDLEPDDGQAPQDPEPPRRDRPADPPRQPPEPASEPEGTEPAEDGEEAPEGHPKPADEALSPSARERIDRLTREKYEYKRQAEALQRQWDEFLRQQAALQPPQPGQPDPAAVEKAKADLRQEAAQKEFNDACNATFTKGKAEFGGFETDVAALNSVGAGDNIGFLRAIAHMKNGHRVYHHLAQNLDEAARIVALAANDPDKMRDALYELRAELPDLRARTLEPNNLQQPTSRAPEPIRPLGGNAGRASPNLAKVSMAEYIRIRDREDQEDIGGRWRS